MPPKIDDKDLQSLLSLYSVTQAEITRYRDREWANAGLFTASIAAVIGFIVANQSIAQDFAPLFDIALTLIAVGNIFYSCYAHDRLTIQRNVRARIEYLLNFADIQVETKRLLPYDIRKPDNDSFRRGWFRGFFSHLLPFFLASISLAVFGIWLVHH